MDWIEIIYAAIESGQKIRAQNVSFWIVKLFRRLNIGLICAVNDDLFEGGLILGGHFALITHVKWKNRIISFFLSRIDLIHFLKFMSIIIFHEIKSYWSRSLI